MNKAIEKLIAPVSLLLVIIALREHDMKKLVLKFVMFLAIGTAFAQQSRQFVLEQSNSSPTMPGGSPELYFATGHSNSINCTAWSRDGKYIASASSDQTIRIWDAASGRELRTLTGHTHNVDYVSWSPDGTMLASISNHSMEAFIWDVCTGTIVKRIKMDYSGGTFAWGATNSQYALIDHLYARLYDGSEWTELKHLSGAVKSVLYSPDGQYVVTAGYDKTVRVLNVATKKEVAVCKGHSEAVMYACFSPDGKYVASAGSDGTARVWDAFSGKKKLRLKISSLFAERVSWSPDGRCIAAYGSDGLKIYDASNGKLLYEQKDFGSGLCAESWSPDGKFLVTGGRRIEYFLKIKSTQNWDDRFTLGNNLVEIRQIDLNSDETLIASTAKEKLVRVWNVASGDNAAMITSDTYSGLAWNNGGAIAFSNNYHIHLYESKTGKTYGPWNSFHDNKLAFSVEGKYLAVENHLIKEGGILIYSGDTGKFIVKLPLDDGPEALAFSPDGIYLAAGSDKGNVRIWETSNWKLVKELTMPKKDKRDNNVYALAWSPDSKQLAIGSSDYLMVWNTHTWKQETVSFEDATWQFAVTWTPDGAYLVSGGTQGTIRVWNPKNGTEVRTFQHYGWVRSLAITRDGKRLFSAGDGGTIKAWDFATGNLLYTTLNGVDGEWLTYTPEGYFTGTEWASQNLVYIVDGMDIIGLDQVYDTFCRPDLVAAKFAGTSTAAAEIPLLNEVVSSGDAPVVQFTGVPASSASRDVTVKFTVQDKGGGIGNVYISVNGRVSQLAEGSRAFALVGGGTAGGSQASGTRTYDSPVTLQDGENVIMAYATNAAGKIESRRAQAKITWQGQSAKPSLYVLAVGVNDYKARGVSKLRYAVPDVQSVASTMQGAGRGTYGTVNVSQLTDAQASSAGIEAEFSRLSSVVKPDDVFVLYISGHGTSYNGDYYFIPADFDGNLSSAVSKAFIMRNVQKIAAQKAIVILDTCYSGAIVNDSDTTAYQRLARSTGLAVLAASSDVQSALEGYEGHGIFTYALLEGLAGKADLMRDDTVTLMELVTYLSGTVPALTERLWDYRQVPWHDTRGQDFVLVGK